MKAKELKNILDKLSPKQLEQELYINIEETPLKAIYSVEVIKHTYVHYPGEGIFRHGNNAQGSEPCPPEWEKGNIHIHVEEIKK